MLVSVFAAATRRAQYSWYSNNWRQKSSSSSTSLTALAGYTITTLTKLYLKNRFSRVFSYFAVEFIPTDSRQHFCKTQFKNVSSHKAFLTCGRGLFGILWLFVLNLKAYVQLWLMWMNEKLMSSCSSRPVEVESFRGILTGRRQCDGNWRNCVNFGAC